MRLIFTKLDIYRKCPLRFRLRYQEKLPEVSMGGRNLSLILHQTLRSFLFNARRAPGLEALLRTYADAGGLPLEGRGAAGYGGSAGAEVFSGSGEDGGHRSVGLRYGGRGARQLPQKTAVFPYMNSPCPYMRITVSLNEKPRDST